MTPEDVQKLIELLTAADHAIDTGADVEAKGHIQAALALLDPDYKR